MDFFRQLLLLDGSCAWIDLEACGTGHPAFSIQALYCPDFLGMLPGIAPHDAEILRRFWILQLQSLSPYGSVLAHI